MTRMVLNIVCGYRDESQKQKLELSIQGIVASWGESYTHTYYGGWTIILRPDAYATLGLLKSYKENLEQFSLIAFNLDFL